MTLTMSISSNGTTMDDRGNSSIRGANTNTSVDGGGVIARVAKVLFWVWILIMVAAFIGQSTFDLVKEDDPTKAFHFLVTGA